MVIYLFLVLAVMRLASGQYYDQYSNPDYSIRDRQYLPPKTERYYTSPSKYSTVSYNAAYDQNSYDQRQYTNELNYQDGAEILPYQTSYNNQYHPVSNGLVGSSEYQNQYNPNYNSVSIGGSPSAHYQSRLGHHSNYDVTRPQSDYSPYAYQQQYQNHDYLARNGYQNQNYLAAGHDYQHQQRLINNELQPKRVYDYLPPQESTYVRSFRSADKAKNAEKA